MTKRERQRHFSLKGREIILNECGCRNQRLLSGTIKVILKWRRKNWKFLIICIKAWNYWIPKMQSMYNLSNITNCLESVKSIYICMNSYCAPCSDLNLPDFATYPGMPRKYSETQKSQSLIKWTLNTIFFFYFEYQLTLER